MYRVQVAPGTQVDVQEAADTIIMTYNSPATTPCNRTGSPGFCTAPGSNYSTAACAVQPFSSSTPLYCPSVGHSWALNVEVPAATSCDTAYAGSQVVKDEVLAYVVSLVVDPVIASLPEDNVRCFNAVSVSTCHTWELCNPALMGIAAFALFPL
jgi:hypothetical protein